MTDPMSQSGGGIPTERDAQDDVPDASTVMTVSTVAHMPAIDFACANISLLASENCQALPSDIMKASAVHGWEGVGGC